MKTYRLALSDLPSGPAWLEGPAFFSSSGFMRLWSILGGEPVYIAVESDRRMIGCLPGVEFGIKGLRRFQAMPNGCYGRTLTDPEYDSRRAEIAAHVLEFLAGAGYVKVYITDYYHHFGRDDRYDLEEDSTLLVDVSIPDWEPPDKKLCQQVRKGIREGRTITRFNPGSHMNGFLRLVSLSTSRLGREQFFPPAFYDSLARLAAQDERVLWKWMEQAGRPVASSIFLVEGDQLLHWQTYFDESASHLQPNKIIPYLAAKDWAAAGGQYLNLGATPANVPGVLEYKRKWGGEEYKYHTLVRKTGLGRLR